MLVANDPSMNVVADAAGVAVESEEEARGCSASIDLVQAELAAGEGVTSSTAGKCRLGTTPQ